jgi:enamine deaminase RidA (YjgF/YER057c/UK114 family)
MTSSSTPDPATPAQTPYDRLSALGLTLPKLPPAVANFLPAVREGDLLYLSGQGPVHAGGFHSGKVGADVSLQDAYEHAKLTGLNLLAAIEDSLGDLGKVRKVVKLLGMVNAAPDFVAHPLVVNGCSDLLVAVFGPEIGRHARSAVGMGSLPGQITVEMELIVAVAD